MKAEIYVWGSVILFTIGVALAVVAITLVLTKII